MSERNIEPGFKRKITTLNWINETHFITLLVNVQGFNTGLQLVSKVVCCSVYTAFAVTHQAFTSSISMAFCITQFTNNEQQCKNNN